MVMDKDKNINDYGVGGHNCNVHVSGIPDYVFGS